MPNRAGWTVHFESSEVPVFDDEAVCVLSARGTEDRSRAPFWDDVVLKHPNACWEIEEQLPDDVVAVKSGERHRVGLRDAASLRSLMLGRPAAYIDVSGLAHDTWAPLLREALTTVATLWVIYAEPERYRPHANPASWSVFDLSTSIGGVAPLPGFANLRGPHDESSCAFVPFLGFEGMRARQIALSLDPVPPVVPVVGVPGFRIEYPQFTVACNQEFLHEHQAHVDVRLARASCPFEAYRALADIAQDHPGTHLYIAPIGTKPHAVGAVWFAIDHPECTELLYDHPVRRPKRTLGVGPIHFYCLRDGGSGPFCGSR